MAKDSAKIEARKQKAREKRAKLKMIRDEQSTTKDQLIEATLSGADTTPFVEALNKLIEAELKLTTRPTAWVDGHRKVRLDEHYWIRGEITSTSNPECSGQVFLLYDETVVMQDSGAFVNEQIAQKCLNAVINAYRTCYKLMTA